MFKITQLLYYLATLRAERLRPSFGAKLEAWRHKMLHIFYFLQSDTVFGIRWNFLLFKVCMRPTGFLLFWYLYNE